MKSHTTASASDTAEQRFESFPRVPRELRDMVYFHAMNIEGHFAKAVDLDMYIDVDPATPYFFLSYITHLEASSPKSATFSIGSIHANTFLMQFLNSIPRNRGHLSVRSLTFPSYHWFQGLQQSSRNVDMDLVIDCSALRSLTLSMHMQPLIQKAPDAHWDSWNGRWDRYVYTDIEQVIDHFDLQQVFHCRNLKELHLDGISDAKCERCCPGVKQRMEEVAKWMKDGFLECQGREVVVCVTWREPRPSW